MSTPQVKCCQDISYHVYVREGYYWSQSHELLKQWARTLWQAAERLYTHPQSYRHVQARANSFQTIKHLAQLSMAILAKDKNRGGWNRPDCRALTVGRGRAILFNHLRTPARKRGMPEPVARDRVGEGFVGSHPLTA